IRIPATVAMTWNTALTTATLSGTGATKVATTVSYEDGGKTLVLSVTTNFVGSEQLVVSGLQYKSFTSPSAADYLQLVVTGAGGERWGDGRGAEGQGAARAAAGGVPGGGGGGREGGREGGGRAQDPGEAATEAASGGVGMGGGRGEGGDGRRDRGWKDDNAGG